MRGACRFWSAQDLSGALPNSSGRLHAPGHLAAGSRCRGARSDKKGICRRMAVCERPSAFGQLRGMAWSLIFSLTSHAALPCSCRSRSGRDRPRDAPDGQHSVARSRAVVAHEPPLQRWRSIQTTPQRVSGFSASSNTKPLSVIPRMTISPACIVTIGAPLRVGKSGVCASPFLIFLSGIYRVSDCGESGEAVGKDLPRFTAPRSNSVNQTQQRPALAWRLMPHRTSRRKRSNARRFAATSRLSARSRAACSATKRRRAAASARAACEYRPWVHRARRLRSRPSFVRGPVL